jgi:putative CocE/NonD family hydrolase
MKTTKWAAWVGGVVGAFACVLVLSACATQRAPESAVAVTMGAARSDRSYYLPMRDGVRLALNLYFPSARAADGRAPVLLIQTRYGRAQEARRGGAPRDIDYFLQSGFVVAIVDTRGSTSSFGAREVEMGPDERADMDEIIAHLAAQPWSDGRVIAYGVSYMADTAAFAASRPAPGLVAAIPRQLDFDAYTQGFMPGGVQNDFLLYVWGNYTQAIDLGRSPDAEGLDCVARVEDCAALYPLLQPVDEDRDFALLRQALSQRRRWAPEDYVNAPFRDDAGANGFSLFDFSPAADLAGLRREAKPMMVWGSWLDATTADAALSLYRSAPEIPLEVWITANNHGHDRNADPFLPMRVEPIPDRDAQMARVLDFANRVLAGRNIERRIHYYVLGARQFRQTPVWPPAGLATETFFLAPDQRLSRRTPEAGEIVYDVDFNAGTGANTRWSTQFGPAPAYPDRRAADARLLVFDSEPMPASMELVGQPVIELQVSVDRDDAAVFVYLEDVAPDGRVTYITEGQLRALHRAPADAAALPFDQGPAAHSFRRADASPVREGAAMTLRFALNPTAALIREGHRLRISVAGADADVFRRYPDEGALSMRLRVGAETPSRLEAPMRPWR